MYNNILKYFNQNYHYYKYYNYNNKVTIKMPPSVNSSENDHSSFAADENEINENNINDNNETQEYVDKSILSDPLLVKLTTEMERSNKIFMKRQSIINIDDKNTMAKAKVVLKDIYNDCNFIKKKINKKNDMDRSDRSDIQEQIENIEVLNNICMYIYDKFKKKPEKPKGHVK